MRVRVSWSSEETLDREVVRSNPGTDYYIDSLLTAICCKKASLIEKSKIKRREWRTILKKPNGWRTYNNLWLMLTSFNVCKKLGYRKHTFLSSRWPIAGCRHCHTPNSGNATYDMEQCCRCSLKK